MRQRRQRVALDALSFEDLCLALCFPSLAPVDLPLALVARCDRSLDLCIDLGIALPLLQTTRILSVSRVRQAPAATALESPRRVALGVVLRDLRVHALLRLIQAPAFNLRDHRAVCRVAAGRDDVPLAVTEVGFNKICPAPVKPVW